MSGNAEQVYWPKSSFKEVSANKIEFAFHKDTLIELLTNNQFETQNGWIKGEIFRRNMPSKLGSTHAAAIKNESATISQLAGSIGKLTDDQQAKILKQVQKELAQNEQQG